MRYHFCDNGGINWVWILCYEEVPDGVRLVFHERWHNGDDWPKWVEHAYLRAERECQVKEGPGRVAVALLFDKFEERSDANGFFKFLGRREMPIVNPAYVFDFDLMLRGLEEVRDYMSSPEFGAEILYDAVCHLQRLSGELSDADVAACDLMGKIMFEELEKEIA